MSFTQTYEFGEKLYSSAFSEVRNCYHIGADLHRTVNIVKNIQNDFSGFELRSQLCKLLDLDHTNIVRVFDLLYDSKRLFMVLENWDGDLLLDILTRRTEITERDIVDIAEQLLSALSFAHSKGVVHGNLHLGQIYLIESDEKYWVKVIGFGLSEIISYKHVQFLAPVISSDVWSVGVVLYILFTGRPPFTRSEKSLSTPLDIELLKKVGASESAVDFISKMLVVNPNYRISAEFALMHPWIQLFKSEQPLCNSTLSLENLIRYRRSSAYKEAIHEFIATQVLRNSEIKELQEAFKVLDKNGDGKLARSKLQTYFAKKMPPDEADIIIDSIMSQTDTDNSGFLEYTEFIKAGAMQKHFLSKDNLMAAFSLLDADCNGCLLYTSPSPRDS